MTAAFTIEVLGAGEGRKTFRSGVEALDRYLVERASQDVRRRLSNCFVARDERGVMAGYYTLAASSVPLFDLPAEIVKKLPRYGLIPAGLIGRLAVDQAFQGRGLRAALVMDAAWKAATASPAVFALIVDAKDSSARGFYERLGFLRFESREMSLFLPIATAMAAF